MPGLPDRFFIRGFDIVLAGILLLLTLPLTLISLLLSALFVGFPPVYISRRIGKNGVPYRHVKIRSLRPGKEVGPIFHEQHRLNGCGKLLRGYHLDELPELWHILAGRMSFVGPRPLQPQYLEGLDIINRHAVPPGWTCTAQIVLLKKGRLNKYLQIRLDNIYVRRRSFAYNIRILAGTFRAFLRRREPDLRPDSTPDRREFARKQERV